MAGEFDWLVQLLTGAGSLATARGDTAGSRGLNDYISNTPASGASNQAGVTSSLAGLMSFLQNPSSIRDNPAYQAGLGFGVDAVNRGAGASGMFNSGNRGLALEKFGQDYGMGFENQIYNQLLGGVNANIGVGDLGLRTQNQGYNQQLGAAGLGDLERTRQAGSIGSGIGGIANGIGGLFSNPAFIRMLSGFGSGSFDPSSLNLGGLDPGTVYGPDSGWGQDVLGGGGSGLDFSSIDPGADWSALFSGLGGP